MFIPPHNDEELLTELSKFSNSSKEVILAWVYKETGQDRKNHEELTFEARSILLKIWQIYVCKQGTLIYMIDDFILLVCKIKEICKDKKAIKFLRWML